MKVDLLSKYTDSLQSSMIRQTPVYQSWAKLPGVSHQQCQFNDCSWLQQHSCTLHTPTLPHFLQRKIVTESSLAMLYVNVKILMINCWWQHENIHVYPCIKSFHMDMSYREPQKKTLRLIAVHNCPAFTFFRKMFWE